MHFFQKNAAEGRLFIFLGIKCLLKQSIGVISGISVCATTNQQTKLQMTAKLN